MTKPGSITSIALRLFMPLLLVLSIAEFHLYRLPQAGLGTEQGGSEVLMRMAHPWGTLSHGLATALAAAAMFLVVAHAVASPARAGPGRLYYWPLVLVLVLMGASLFQPGADSGPSMVALQVASMLLVGCMALRFLYHEHEWAEKTMIALFAAYQLIPRYVLATSVPQRHASGGHTYPSSSLLTAGELIMVAAMLALVPAYIKHFRRISLRKKMRPLIVASAIAALLAKLYLDNPSAAALSLSQTSGFQLLLPFPFYIMAIWLVVFFAIALRADQGQNRYTGYGLIFIFLSGFLLLNPYQHLLSGLGFTLLGMKNALNAS